MNYNTRLTTDPTQFSKNFYNTVEVWGGLNVAKRWQLLYILPYHLNKQIDDDGITSKNGPGDVTLLANYLLLHKIKTYDNKAGIEQQLWVGGGMKLPTGKFDANVKDPNTTIADVNAQLGTGSIDFLLNAMYNVRIGNWGINTTVSYKTNTANNTYRFGNNFTANSIVYYRLRFKRINVTPNLGVMYENTWQNVLHKQPVATTGGYIATAGAGAELNFGKIMVGFSVQAPFSQYYAEGQTRLNWKGNLHVSFAF